jgi:phosphate starvation-inducible PhoH-like protein
MSKTNLLNMLQYTCIISLKDLSHTSKMHTFTAATVGQAVYLKSLRSSSKPIVVATGPPGTGKSLLACQVGAEKLHAGHVHRLIITRPAVCADEDLGYLPGSLEDKMDPFMRPIMDILSGYFTKSRVKMLMAHGDIEIAPLAYMRGRTFACSYIIGDEMQNSTSNQMKMLLTRLGEDSKLVVTGDVDQCDLRLHEPNGLLDITSRMVAAGDLKFIDHVVLTQEDIQRHRAVSEVLQLYV